MIDREQLATPEYWRDAEIFAYVRKSLVLGEEDRISEVKQRDAIAAACERLPLPAPAADHWYADVDGHRSGRYEHTRPGWRRMKSRLLQSPKAVLIVYELDRSNRNVQATAELVETFRLQPTRFRLILLQNRFDSAIHGWGAREIKALHQDAADAQYESDKAAERMTATISVLKAHDVPWGTTPYGFVRTGRGLKARWDPGSRAGDVIRLIEAWAMPSASYQTVADELNAGGVYYWKRRRDRAGNVHELPQRWTKFRVCQIVRNVLRYAGYNMPNAGRARRRQVKLAGAGTLLQRYAQAYGGKLVTSITPLISVEVAELVVAKIQSNGGRGRRPNADWTPWLSGLLEYNGQRLRAQNAHGLHYYCTRGRGRMSWHADALERELLDNLRGVGFPPVTLAKIEELVGERSGDARREQWARQAADMRAALTSLERKSALGDFDGKESIYLQLRAEFGAALREAELQLAAAGQVSAVVAKLADLGATVAQMSPTQRQRALTGLFAKIELSAEGAVMRITPQAWAKVAFGELVWAWRYLHPTEKLPKVTPTGVERSLGNTAWLLDRIAA